jgi:hypothetical protein
VAGLGELVAAGLEKPAVISLRMEAPAMVAAVPTRNWSASVFAFEPFATGTLGGSLPGSVGGLPGPTEFPGNGGLPVLSSGGRYPGGGYPGGGYPVTGVSGGGVGGSRRLRLCSRTSLEELNMVSKASALTQI